LVISEKEDQILNNLKKKKKQLLCQLLVLRDWVQDQGELNFCQF